MTIAKELAELLNLVEGVSVEHFRAHPRGKATYLLRVTQPASLARLACWATNCNVPLVVWADSEGKSEEEWNSLERVRFALCFDMKMNRISPPLEFSDLQIFGGKLISDLAFRGRMDKGKADALLTSWGLPWSQC